MDQYGNCGNVEGGQALDIFKHRAIRTFQWVKRIKREESGRRQNLGLTDQKAELPEIEMCPYGRESKLLSVFFLLVAGIFPANVKLCLVEQD